jgi:hypothetical protein
LSGEHGINVALDVSKFVLKNSPVARQAGWGAQDATINVVQMGSRFEKSTVKSLDGEVVKQPSDDAAKTPSRGRRLLLCLKQHRSTPAMRPSGTREVTRAV